MCKSENLNLRIAFECTQNLFGRLAIDHQNEENLLDVSTESLPCSPILACIQA